MFLSHLLSFSNTFPGNLALLQEVPSSGVLVPSSGAHKPQPDLTWHLLYPSLYLSVLKFCSPQCSAAVFLLGQQRWPSPTHPLFVRKRHTVPVKCWGDLEASLGDVSHCGRGNVGGTHGWQCRGTMLVSLSLSLSALINILLFLALPICNLVYQTTETQGASVSAGCGVGGRVNKISS